MNYSDLFCDSLLSYGGHCDMLLLQSFVRIGCEDLAALAA